MDITDVEIEKLLPQFMRNDKFFTALSGAMSEMFRGDSKNIELISRIGKIDELPESMLDEIAWENNLFWYYKDDNIETKRKNIKNYKKVLYSLGTPGALQIILDDIYGSAELQESFNFPDNYRVHEFGVLVPNQNKFSAENKNRLLKRINDVKRASQKLHEIFYFDSSKIKMFVGMGQAEIIEQFTQPIAWPNAEIELSLIVDYGLTMFINKSDCSMAVAE